MSHTSQFRAERMIWRFEHSGGAGLYTHAYRDCPLSWAEAISGIFKCGADEIPVLISFRDPDDWVLITTDRVITRRMGSSSSVRLDEVAGASIERGLSVEDGEIAASGKGEWDSIAIHTVRGARHVVRIESGGPLFGVLNVLLIVVSRNRASCTRRER